MTFTVVKNAYLVLLDKHENGECRKSTKTESEKKASIIFKGADLSLDSIIMLLIVAVLLCIDSIKLSLRAFKTRAR